MGQVFTFCTCEVVEYCANENVTPECVSLAFINSFACKSEVVESLIKRVAFLCNTRNVSVFSVAITMCFDKTFK